MDSFTAFKNKYIAIIQRYKEEIEANSKTIDLQYVSAYRQGRVEANAAISGIQNVARTEADVMSYYYRFMSYYNTHCKNALLRAANQGSPDASYSPSTVGTEERTSDSEFVGDKGITNEDSKSTYEVTKVDTSAARTGATTSNTNLILIAVLVLLFVMK